MTDMRARYLGRCARTFAMVLSCCFFRCESLLNRAARRLGGIPSPPFAPRNYAHDDARDGDCPRDFARCYKSGRRKRAFPFWNTAV